jgi:pyrroloquinoline-quinone synthase
MQKTLDSILEKWDLLKHPFYQAWSAGSLPMSALGQYATEYAAFINLLPAGWTAIGDPATANEESEHAQLWQEFGEAIGAPAASTGLAETARLVQTAQALFSRRVTALGAMYAFEAQQPETAASKLKGLQTHYQLPSAAHEYFSVHADNASEAATLRARLEGLSAEERAEALAACEQMSVALWDALSGIHDASCPA